ncbi:MAG: AAA family ATPase, partial [Pseudomonadota bacterium]
MELLQSFAFESAEALLAAVAVAALIAIFWLGFGVRKIFSEAELARAEERLRETASALDGAKTELAATTNELAATHARLEASQSVIRRIERGLSDGGVLLRPLDPQAAALRSSASIPIIAVGNLKGGVGKTTLAANLGAYLGDQRRGDRRGPVLFIDLDFQGSLSSILSLSGRDALALEGVDAP